MKANEVSQMWWLALVGLVVVAASTVASAAVPEYRYLWLTLSFVGGYAIGAPLGAWVANKLIDKGRF